MDTENQKEIAEEQMIEQAFQELLNDYLATKHRKRIEIITHARAGRLLREAFPQRGNSATDIAEMLPRARIREAAGDGA